LFGLFGQQGDVGRGPGEVGVDVSLNPEVDVGDEIAVTFVLDRARLRLLEFGRTDLCCLPGYFEKLLNGLHKAALPRFQGYSNTWVKAEESVGRVLVRSDGKGCRLARCIHPATAA
jgi:hypothetical protein